MQIFTSLRVKLILVFVGLMLIAIAGMVLYGYYFTRTALHGQALERSRHQVHLQAESIVSSLKQAGGDALYLSALRSFDMLQQVMRNDSPEDEIAVWRREVAQDLLMFLSVRPMYQSLRYIDAQGQEIVSVESDGRRVSTVETGTDHSGTHYFQNTMALQPGETYVSSFTQETATSRAGRPFLHYTLKLAEGDGIVLIHLHAGWLLRNLPADPGKDNWVILDQDGTFLVYPEAFDPAASGVDVRPMLEGSAGSIETSESVFVYDSLHPSDATTDRFWVVFRQTPKSLLYADVTTFYAITTAVILSVTLLALALALYASGRILKPLLDLERQTAAFGLGGPAPALPARISQDEIGMLTRTFAQMARELEHKRQQEHRLIEKLIDAQEEERKLVAYDLHDGLIQQLVGARYYLNNIYEQRKDSAESGSEDIRRGCETLTEAIIEGRRIVEGLRPAVLDDLGLTVALEEVAQVSAQASGWTLELDVESIPVEPDKAVGVTVFRIAQEALNNIRKHAEARHVRLTMRNGSGIDLLIQDDGKGFASHELNGDTRGLGVTTMKERATLIHGTCEISSVPGGGTTVHIWVPLSPHAAAPDGRDIR